MRLFSLAPLPVGVLPWCAPEPRVTVITKLTLAYGPSGFAIADEQEPLCHALPSLFGNAIELHHPTDFVPAKARCDVLLTGSAYAAMPLSAIGARVRIGAFQKRFFALAGEVTTAIPLSSSYLRRRRKLDAERLTVGARSASHPERARFTSMEALAATSSLPADFDFTFFNAAPEDQQIDPVGPGTPISLEGLSPDGSPCSGALPQDWPQVFALDPEGHMTEIPLVCDTLWFDTDRTVCELTLRGVWRPSEAERAGPIRREAGQKPPLPLGLVVLLRPLADRAPLQLADFSRATKGSALFPEDVADELDPADFEELEPEPTMIQSAAIVDEPTVERADRPRTEPPPPTEAARPPSEAPRAASGPRPPAEAPRAIGLLGAMQLRHPRPVDMPALPAETRRPATLPLTSTPRRSGTLPFMSSKAVLEALGQQPSSTPAQAPSPPDGPKRLQTLQIDPWAAGRAPLPFRGTAPVAPPAPPAAPQNAADDGPRRPRTLELLPGTRVAVSTPFPIPESTPRVRIVDSQTARARFLALTSAGSSGAPPAAPRAPLSEQTSTEEALVPDGSTPAETWSAPWERPRPKPPVAENKPSPGAESVPWERPRPMAPITQNRPSPVIERIGSLPLAVDAAIQQEIWRGESSLQDILARHHIDEVTWRDHLRRREEALRDDAEKGAADRASAERQALERARIPAESPREPALDLETYAAIRALLDDSPDDEPGVLAARGIPKETWDREHRAYRKRLRAEPALAEQFKAALATLQSTPAAPTPPAAPKKKTISKKYKPGAQAAGSAASPAAPEKKNLGAARRTPA